MTLRTRAIAVAALLAGLQACAGGQPQLDSDAPRRSAVALPRWPVLRRSGGTVTGGRFLLAGEVPDAAATLESTVDRFVANGWRVDAKEAGLDLSTARFSKGARTVTLSIARRTLEPDMSTGMLEVTSSASTTAP